MWEFTTGKSSPAGAVLNSIQENLDFWEFARFPEAFPHSHIHLVVEKRENVEDWEKVWENLEDEEE